MNVVVFNRIFVLERIRIWWLQIQIFQIIYVWIQIRIQISLALKVGFVFVLLKIKDLNYSSNWVPICNLRKCYVTFFLFFCLEDMICPSKWS